MADLTLRIKGDVDVNSLVGLTDTAEGLAKALKDVEAAADDVNGKDVKINIETTTRGSGVIKEAFEDTDKLDKGTQKLAKSIRKLTTAEQGSVASSRALVATLTQQRNATQTGSLAYATLTKRLQTANDAYNKARGIQQGSITQLRQQVSTLKEVQANNVLSASATKTYSDAINTLNSRIRTQQGIQKGSKRDLQAIRTETLAALDATNKFTDPKNFARLAAELAGVEGQLSALESPTKKLARLIDTLGRIRVAVDAVSDAFRIVNGTIAVFVTRTKQVESFNLALQNIGLNATEANNAFKQAAATSNALGAPLQGVERSYRRMIPSLKSIGVSAADSDKFIANLAARTQVLGLNTEESGRLVEAFAQVLSKGRLSGEELNQQISELDGAFRSQLAQALGLTTQQLVQFVETGQVGSAKFVQAFLKMENGVGLLQDRLTSGNATVQQLQNLLQTINTKNIESLAASFDPLFRAILRAQLAFAQLVNAIASSSAFSILGSLLADIVEGFTFLTRTLLSAVTGFVQLIEPIISTAKALGDAIPFSEKLGQALGVLLAIVAQNVVFGLLSKAIAAVGVAAATSSGPLAIFGVLLNGLGGAFAAVKTGGLVAGFVQLAKAAQGFIGSNIAQFVARLGRVLGPVFKGALALGKALLTVKGFAIAAGVAVGGTLIKGIFDYQAGQNKAKVATEETTKVLQRYNSEVANTKGPDLTVTGDPSFIDRLFNVIKVKAFNDNLAGFTDELQKSDANINKLTQSSAKFGGMLTKNTDLTKVSGKNLIGQRRAIRAENEARKEQIAVIEEQIATYKKEHPEQKTTIRQLESELASSKTLLRVKENLAKNLDKEISKRIENGEAIGTQAERLQVLGAALTRLEKSKEAFSAAVEAKTYADLRKNIISAEQAEAQRQAATGIGASATIKNMQLQVRELQKQRAENGELNDEEKKRLEDLKKGIRENRTVQQQAFLAIKNSIVNAFAAGIKKQQELADVSIQSGQRIKAVFDSIGGTTISGLQAGLQVVTTISQSILAGIDREANARMQAVENAGVKGVELERTKAIIQQNADEQKRKVLQQELAVKSRAAAVEQQVESIRLDVSSRVAIIEAQITQQRLAAEAAIAKARGQNDLASALSNAARAQDQVIAGIRVERDLQQQILQFRRDQQDAAIAAQAQAAGISGFRMPGFNDQIRKLERFTTQSKNALSNFEGLATKSLEVGRNLDAGAIARGDTEARKVADSVKAAADDAVRLDEGFRNAAAGMKAIANNSLGLIRNLRLISSFASRRAMGGPVEAGSTYTVNDGGGREAFMNKFGRMSMLPAGRNIKWTAPTSGTVIPAHLVSDFMKTRSVNETVNNMTTKNEVHRGVSGNLITQASTNSSRTSSNSNQRITNNVTIQSQTPVMDASLLMTQVQKIKNRRRI